MRHVFFFLLFLIVVLFIWANLPSRTPTPGERDDLRRIDIAPESQPTPTPYVATPTPYVAPPRGPRPSAPQTVSRAKLDLLMSLARKAGVTVQITGVQGMNVSARVEWMGDVATIGADYLEMTIREGVVWDFEDRGGRRWYDPQARSHWTQDYLLKLR
ncbi:hypothetical protein JW916_01080 [Candidatus Sumerlaeota bacterium]|nr:hypothetical protein [Candidatus Sumerlaeota bacterium]